MRPILWTIGSLTISSYSFMSAIGFLVAVFIAILRAKKVGIWTKSIIDLSLYVFIGGLIGARLFHKLQHFGSYNSISDALNIMEGGFAYYGGFISAFLIGVIYLKVSNLSIAQIADIVAPSLAIGEGIGRIGCFMAGCCFGKPTDSMFGVSYPQNSLVWTLIGSQKVHPTQIYSAIALFCIFRILMAIQKYTTFRGQLFLMFLLIHSVFRFSIDFLRYYTPEEHISILTTSQFISMIIGLGAVITMVIFIFNNRKNDANA
jgi:phosphatidylglycerol:prolipoprotein diacylglycerol transferase